MAVPRRQSLRILLVEDSPSDAFFATEALQETNPAPEIYTVQDGVEALAFLRRQGTHAQAPRPDLILLDLNLPRKDGREVLSEIKDDADLRSIPVIILTSSGAEPDVVKAYDLHANCYITKPVNYSQFKQVIKALEDFWFTHVTLPPGR